MIMSQGPGPVTGCPRTCLKTCVVCCWLGGIDGAEKILPAPDGHRATAGHYLPSSFSTSGGFARFRQTLWNIGPVTTGPMFHRVDGGQRRGRHGGCGWGARDWCCSGVGAMGIRPNPNRRDTRPWPLNIKSLPGLNLIGHGGSGIDDGGASIPIRTFASPVLNGVRDWSSRAGRHETMMPRPAPGSLIDGYRGPARRHPPRHLTPRPI